MLSAEENFMKFSKNNLLRYYIFLAVVTLAGGFFFILPDFIIYPTSGLKGIIYTILHWALTCLPLFLLLYLISINKYVFAVVFPIVAFLGILVGFYSFFYKAILTPMIVDATLNNDLGTSLDVISPLLIGIIFSGLAIAIVIINYRFRYISLKKQFLHFAGVVLAFIVLFNVNGRVTNTFAQHYPASIYTNLREYNKLKANRNLPRIYPDSTLNYTSAEDITVVFVIGESLRADHLSINGYERNTTPLLSQQTNIVSLPNIYSEFAYTNPSVAHIMTRADSVYTERSDTEKSFISQFNSSGFYTAWLANQDAAITYYPFMLECDTLIYAHPEKSVYTFSDWLDEDLLPILDFTLTNTNKNKLLILHTIGSHWYYNSHYSEEFQIFNPVTKSKIISQNTAEEIINSYDNTVVYTDYFINRVISKLTSENAVLIYLSDHGEALGEEGNWLHASDNEYLKNPACFVWYSEKYSKKYPQKIEALRKNKDIRYRTDFLYHSILSIANIPSKVIESNFDIFTEKK